MNLGDEDEVRAIVRRAALNIEVQDREQQILARGAGTRRRFQGGLIPLASAAAIGGILITVAIIRAGPASTDRSPATGPVSTSTQQELQPSASTGSTRTSQVSDPISTTVNQSVSVTPGTTAASNIVLPAETADAVNEWHNLIVNYINAHPTLFTAVRSIDETGSLLVTPSEAGGAMAVDELKVTVGPQTKKIQLLLTRAGAPIPELKFGPAQRYSQADLLAAQNRLTAALTAKESWSQGIVEYGPTLDGTFSVGTTGDPSDDTARLIEEKIGVPVILAKVQPSS